METLKTIFMGGLLCVGIATCLYIIFAIVNAFFETKKRVKHQQRMEELEYLKSFMEALDLDAELEEIESKKETKKKSKK